MANSCMDLQVHAPAAWQRNFAGHPDKCPASRFLGKSVFCGAHGTLGFIPLLLWRYKLYGMAGFFGPPLTMRSGPRRTRRLRLGLSTEHGPSVFQFVRRLSFKKFCRLTPSGTAGVKPSSDGGGGRSYRSLLALRTLCDCQRN